MAVLPEVWAAARLARRARSAGSLVRSHLLSPAILVPSALFADDIAEGWIVQPPFSEPALPPWRYFMYVASARANGDAVTAFKE